MLFVNKFVAYFTACKKIDSTELGRDSPMCQECPSSGHETKTAQYAEGFCTIMLH